MAGCASFAGDLCRQAIQADLPASEVTMRKETLASMPNLLLGWRRITTGTSATYKAYFRTLYEAYDLSYRENLKDLRARVNDKVYRPTSPLRIYYPKASGLHRPYTLLTLEDQIILQAIANLFTEHIRSKRKPLERKFVFSGILAPKGSQFLFEDWRVGYTALIQRLQMLFRSGHVWLGTFDLSAFYDTISHDILVTTIAPRSGSPELVNMLSQCFREWSAPDRRSQHSHGIPQGPLASRLLAEAVMLPLDLAMAGTFSYTRYVDDIRIMGKSENEVREAVICLDAQCRDIGLIPHADKGSLVELKSVSDLTDRIPTIDAYAAVSRRPQLTTPKAEQLLRESLDASATDVTDKTKFRYALFRSPPSDLILSTVLQLWPRFPEHTDAIVVFLDSYARSQPVVTYCRQALARPEPYAYVRGELWRVLARMCTPAELRRLCDLAVQEVRGQRDSPCAAIGALVFLCSAERNGLGRYSGFLRWTCHELVQAIVAPYLTLATARPSVVKQLLRRSRPDAALALIRSFDDKSIGPSQYLSPEQALPRVVQLVYEAAGILQPTRPKPRDPISTILSRRYGVPNWAGWKSLLGADYAHLHQILTTAEAYFESQLSPWLQNQDSFNDAVLRRFLDLLQSRGCSGGIPSVGGKGELLDFGNLLADPRFECAHRVIAQNLQTVHARRCQVPDSHPYEKRTGVKAIPLRKREQRLLARKLGQAYAALISTCRSLGL